MALGCQHVREDVEGVKVLGWGDMETLRRSVSLQVKTSAVLPFSSSTQHATSKHRSRPVHERGKVMELKVKLGKFGDH